MHTPMVWWLGRSCSTIRSVYGCPDAPDEGDRAAERPTRFDRAGGSMRVRCPIFGRAPLCFGRSAARRSGHVAVSSSYSPDDRADGRFRAINDANVRRARSVMKTYACSSVFLSCSPCGDGSDADRPFRRLELERSRARTCTSFRSRGPACAFSLHDFGRSVLVFRPDGRPVIGELRHSRPGFVRTAA